MIDIKFIRDCLALFKEAMKKRGENEGLVDVIINLDSDIRNKKSSLQDLQTKRNDYSKKISQFKSQKLDYTGLIQEVELINAQIPPLEEDLESLEQNYSNIMLRIPNILDEDVPFGTSEDDNIEIRTVGAKPEFSYPPKQHFELGVDLDVMDFKQAAVISGARFVVLKKGLARMERALANFMLDVHTKEFGYTEIMPPYLVNEKAMIGAGQLPKFDEDSFKTTDGYRLIPTSEVPLTNLVADKLLIEEELPLRLVAYSHCFRSEAGSAGKDTRGMIRQHQFSKVELVSITRPQDAKAELERMTGAAEEILKKLGLSYRVILKCSQDTGFTATKTYDLEVWLPGQDCYREISSCSNCTDFQARRMKARYKELHTQQNRLVHTLNGSGLAIGRTIVAIMENYQLENGDIAIPMVLQPYMDGVKVIGKDS